MLKVITFMLWYVEISRFEGFSSKTRTQGVPVLMNSLWRVEGELVWSFLDILAFILDFHTNSVLCNCWTFGGSELQGEDLASEE
jgi:hypothetical protein